MEYPVQFSVDYPDRRLSRLSTALRIFWVIPIVIVLGTVSGQIWQATYSGGETVAAGAGGALFDRLCVHPRHRRVPAVPAGPVTGLAVSALPG